jgi:hypothetical protein
VSGVFVVCPDGTIAVCCYSLLGNIINIKIAEWGDIIVKLEKVYNQNVGKCSVVPWHYRQKEF